MDHVLDNPVWSALTTGNHNLSNGNNEVKYFAGDVSPFIALKRSSSEAFQELYDVLPHNGPAGFVSHLETDIPKQWKLLQSIPCLQMICENEIAPPRLVIEPVLLTEEDVPQMIALTKLTNPGPFASRTIDFGHYYGVFDGGKLVAMAGQRMNPSPYAEISAVCTHPDYLGRGYAKQLLLHHVHRIKAESNIPFLHVRHDNERAIKVYESLGFANRKNIYFYIMQKVK